MAENVAEGLKRIDPGHSETYDRNLAGFRSRIHRALFGEELILAVGDKRIATLERRLRAGELHDYLKEKGLQDKLGGWLLKAKTLQGLKVVSYHKSFTYFAKTFGLQIVAELEALPGIEPKPQDRDRVVEAVKRHGVKVILHENFYSLAASEYVAEKTGAKVLKAYLDVGASDDVSDYFKLIDRLLNQIVEGVR
jgi:ABC-type Zn uptake system ZnuABC Zn-binding protein ZnuA